MKASTRWQSYDSHLGRIKVLMEDAREFLKGHRVKPAFGEKLKAALLEMERQAVIVHDQITGGN